jgi:hypothetical protein
MFLYRKIKYSSFPLAVFSSYFENMKIEPQYYPEIFDNFIKELIFFNRSRPFLFFEENMKDRLITKSRALPRWSGEDPDVWGSV